MADGEIRVNLDSEALEELRESARALGVSVEAYAAQLVGDALRSDRWAVSRARFAAYQRDGRSISIDDGIAAFDAAVAERRARSR